MLTDAALVGRVGEILTPPVGFTAELQRVISTASWPPHLDSTELAEELLRRARGLQPNEPRWERSLEQLGQARRVAVGERGKVQLDGPGMNGGALSRPDQPRLLERIEPEYPPLARQARLQGSVRLRLAVGEDGRVVRSQVLEGHPLLVAAAREAVSQWRYLPAVDGDGEPTETTIEVSVPFRPEP